MTTMACLSTSFANRNMSALQPLLHRGFSASRSMSSPPVLLPSIHHRRHVIFGANTDVGKTIVSAGLVRSSIEHGSSRKNSIHYVKPMQCGGSDEAFVKKVLALPSSSTTTPSSPPLSTCQARTLFEWETAASPHTASRQEGLPISDRQVMQALHDYLAKVVVDAATAATASSSSSFGSSVTWCETAGGVLSPGASSPDNDGPWHARRSTAPAFSPTSWGWQPQADLYATLASTTSAVLVGDGKLGGISATLSSLESLLWRGYRVPAIVLIAPHVDSNDDDGHNNNRDIHQNATALREYTNGRFGMDNLLVVDLPSIPPDPAVPLDDWFMSEKVTDKFAQLNQHLATDWEQVAMSTIDETIETQDQTVLLQHTTTVSNRNSLAFRLARTWSANARDLVDSQAAQANLTEQVVSWRPHSWVANGSIDTSPWVYQTDITLAAARYKARQQALATYQKRMRVTEEQMATMEWAICKHSSTWTENDQESDSNENDEEEEEEEEKEEEDFSWVAAENLLLDAPTMAFIDGRLRIRFPEGLEASPDTVTEFDSVDKALDVAGRRISPKLYSQYKELIEMQWLVYEHTGISRKIGAIVLEPVLSSDRVWIDPLWQRALIEIGEARNIPIVFDETSLGLGMKGGSQIFGVDPDVAIVGSFPSASGAPIMKTLCTPEVAQVYEPETDELTMASSIVDGIDCVAAVHNMQLQIRSQGGKSPKLAFSEEGVRRLSKMDQVEECFALGNVLCISLSRNARRIEENAHGLRTQLELLGVSVREDGSCLLLVVDPLLGNEERNVVLDTCTRELQ